MICASAGSSKALYVVSWTEKPFDFPAAAISCFAFWMSLWRCGTLLSVAGKTGANGESFPRSARSLKSLLRMAGRSSVSATA